jgi:hypothetical protein
LQNQSRIAILKAREDLIQVIHAPIYLVQKVFALIYFLALVHPKKLKDEAIAQLSVISKDQQQYMELLTNLIAQAMFQLTEPEVKIKCREKDSKLVEHAVQSAIAAYKKQVNRDIKVTMMDQYLPPNM